MSTENTWTPAQSFAIGTVKIGGDAVKVEEPKEEEDKKDGDKSESNGKDSEPKASQTSTAQGDKSFFSNGEDEEKKKTFIACEQKE